MKSLKKYRYRRLIPSVTSEGKFEIVVLKVRQRNGVNCTYTLLELVRLQLVHVVHDWFKANLLSFNLSTNLLNSFSFS